ncbi:hypothetical protein [Streptomyces sp. NPDC017230]|uniref:hypothetical protein n=1 Tax=unclassified Streptomyces TaxID=2593676 RepID=UPI0037881DCD
MVEGKRKFFSLAYDAKGFILSLAFLALLGGVGWFGYAQIFTKGLERLPAKICDGAADRGHAADLLPSARSASVTAEGEDGRKEDGDFVFSCQISTSNDSLLSGSVRMGEVSVEDWVSRYRPYSDSEVVRVSVDRVSALAQLDEEYGTSSVYVPCFSEGAGLGDSGGLHALVARAHVIGESRLTGAELRQAVTDFAYQLTKRAYALGECEPGVDFPERLPRYESS